MMRRCGFNCLVYLDDYYVCAEDLAFAKQHMNISGIYSMTLDL